MKQTVAWKRIVTALASFLILIGCDQWTKNAAAAHLKGQDPFVLWNGVFELHYLENKGAAFGMLQGQRAFFVIMALLASLVLGWLYWKLPWEKRFHPLRITMLLIAAGAVGNLLDRIFLGYVVDFFYFKLIDFPIFNVADIYVTCATIVLACLILFYYKEEELSCLFPSKKER